MFTEEYLLSNQEMCLGIQDTFETADSKRELESVSAYMWEFHCPTIISDPKIALHTNS